MSAPASLRGTLSRQTSRPLLSAAATYSRYMNTFVSEQYSIIRRQCERELGDRVGSFVFDTSYVKLVEWIHTQRMTLMPHKGGSWDRVLVIVQHFAEQLNQLSHSISQFSDGTGPALNLMLGHCLLLLNTGQQNATTLEAVFNLFYQFGLELVPLLRRRDMFSAVSTISDSVGKVFSDLLAVVTAVATTFYQNVHGETIDVYKQFDSHIRTFRHAISVATYAMWESALSPQDGSQFLTIQEKLCPPDAVLAFLAENRLQMCDQPDQFTCTWFQPILTAFVKGEDRVLAVEGKPGSGKSTLAGWTIDRLHRPVGRKSLTAITYSFSSVHDSVLLMIKSLLYQLLTRNIGNVDLFHTISAAMDHSAQEDAMWKTFQQALSRVKEDDVVLVIDGSDFDVIERVRSLGARLITFSQPLETDSKSMVRVVLTSEFLAADISTIARHCFRNQDQFQGLSDADQDKIIGQLTVVADTSLLWTRLACEYVLRCSSFQDALDAVLAALNLGEVVQMLVDVMSLGQDSILLLSLLASCQRPLSAEEMRLLVLADVEQCTMTDRHLDIDLLLAEIKPLIVDREGLFMIRHSLIREALTTTHQDFIMRQFIYAKTCLIGERQPTCEPMDINEVHSTVRSYRLLEYVIRYWAVHFRECDLYAAEGDLELPKDFALVFPRSVMFCLLEEAYIAVDSCLTGYRVRRSLFGERLPCVLQSSIVVAHKSNTFDWYVRATKLSQVIPGAQADVTVMLCEIALSVPNTDISGREEVLLILVGASVQTEQRVSAMERLWQLYDDIGKEHKCVEWRKNIDMCLGKGDARENFLEVTEPLQEGFSFEDCVRIAGHIDVCIHKGDVETAEEFYIELWLKLTEQCRDRYDVDWHCKKIEIMLAYAQFLRAQQRESEACALLLCVWREYEHHECSSFEKLVVLLKDVASCMKDCGMTTTCLVVFEKCLSWCKHTNREDTAMCRDVTTQMTSCSTEDVRSSTVASNTSKVIIRRVFESICLESDTITESTMKMCSTLVAAYCKEENWSEAISCMETALKKSWPSFFLSDRSCTLTTCCTSQSLELCMQLADCYNRQRRYERSEEIYCRLYRAHRKICAIDHSSCVRYIEVILSFYSEYSFFNKAISFYQELLVEYRSHFGRDHENTIRTLYNLGDLCRRHHLIHGYWLEYYLEIVANCNKGSLMCHENALRALVIVAEHHYEACRYNEAFVCYKSIFATFCSKKQKYFEHVSEINLLIEHYFLSIEESQVDIEVYIKSCEELREACLKTYGESSAICISISLTLASVYRRSERHEFKAIVLYEHISKFSKTVSKEVRSSLQYLYHKQIMNSTTVTKERLEKAVALTNARYSEIRKTTSCTHQQTLTQFCQLAELWHKQGKRDVICKETRGLALEIVQVKSSKELIESGKMLAHIYVSCGYQKEAYELLDQLRLQTIYDTRSRGRDCLAFLASLEYYVRHDRQLTLTTLMADLMAESSYYRRFAQCLIERASWDVIFSTGARLRIMYIRRGRDFGFIESECVEHFFAVEPEVVKHCNRTAVRQLISLMFNYCSSHRMTSITSIGHAVVSENSLELIKCAFYLLKTHESLEVAVGFEMAVLMNRGDAAMMEFSKTVLAETFDICENYDIDLASVPLDELNELIEMIGQQRDYERLQWLLRILWSSREGRGKWPRDIVLKLGMRLVQAEFAAGYTKSAIRLCKDLVYNMKRVHGPRHQNVVNMSELLASLHTTVGITSGDKSNFQKAMAVHEGLLKCLVGWKNGDDDEESVVITEDAFDSPQDETDAVVRQLQKLRLAMQRYGGWPKPMTEYARLTDEVWRMYGGQMKLSEDDVRVGKWRVDKVDTVYDCFSIPQWWDVL